VMEVFDIGSRVEIGKKIPAIVTGVCIRNNKYVTYECSWWAGDIHHCEWLAADEVCWKDSESARISIGFK
jgi:hypothetical protein